MEVGVSPDFRVPYSAVVLSNTDGSGGQESAAMQETQAQSLGREDPLEKGVAPHSSILA